MIPKLAHYIWFGNDLPPWALANLNRFKKLHPDWQVILHTRNFPDMPRWMSGAMGDCPQFCSASDLLRLYILYKHGGVYLDFDVVPLRSMDRLLKCGSFCVRVQDGYLNSAVLGTEPNTKEYEKLLNRANDIVKTKNGFARNEFGPALLTSMNNEYKYNPVLLPLHSFYPMSTGCGGKAITWFKNGMKEDFLKTELKSIPASNISDVFGVHIGGLEYSQRELFDRGSAIIFRIWGTIGTQNISGAEIGVETGRVSSWLLSMDQNLDLIMVDRWKTVSKSHPYYLSGDDVAKRNQQDFDANMHKAIHDTDFASHRRHILRMESIDAAKQVPDHSLDFIFIDADHSYEGALSDLDAWSPKVRQGGLISGHDIDHPKYPLWGVRRAVTEYIGRYGKGKIDLGANYTWFVIKDWNDA